MSAEHILPGQEQYISFAQEVDPFLYRTTHFCTGGRFPSHRQMVVSCFRKYTSHASENINKSLRKTIILFLRKREMLVLRMKSTFTMCREKLVVYHPKNILVLQVHIWFSRVAHTSSLVREHKLFRVEETLLLIAQGEDLLPAQDEQILLHKTSISFF